MVWTGIGAFIAGLIASRLKDLRKAHSKIIFYAAAVMPFEIFFMRWLRPFLQKVPTEMLGLTPLLVISFVSVMAICLLFGAWYVLSAKIFLPDAELGQKDFGEVSGTTYSIEALGAVAGGLLSSMFFIKIFNSFQMSIFYSLALFLFLAVFSSKNNYVYVLLAIVALFFSGRIDRASNSFQWFPFEVAEAKNSIYGKISVIKTGEDYDIYLNSARVSSTYLLPSNEELIHIPMLLSGSSPKTLILGGNCKDVEEALKYGAGGLVFPEPDSVYLKLLKKYACGSGLLDRRRVRIPQVDGRFFIKRTTETFDCIVLDVPPPLTGAANRYFTLEFFREVKKILTPGGALIFPLLSSENYMSEELKFLSASIFKTAGSVFKYCYVIPGSNNYFLCSQTQLNLSPELLAAQIKKRNIQTTFLTTYQIKYILRSDRKERLAGWVKEKQEEAIINRDFRPVCYFYGLNYWLSHFGRTTFVKFLQNDVLYELFFGFIILYSVLAIVFKITGKMFLPATMFAVSFAGMMLELLTIFAFQSTYGYVYYKIGLLLALCLLGISAGSFFAGKSVAEQGSGAGAIKKTVLAMAAFALGLPAVFKLLSDNPSIAEPVFYATIFIPGLFVGIVFPLVNKLYNEEKIKTIGNFYSVDLLGATAGSLAASVVFIPLFGLGFSCLITGFLLLILYALCQQ
jgi:spermidine synthase